MNGYQTIALVSACLALVAGAWDANRIRRRQRYSTLALAVGAVGPIVSLVLYVMATNVTLKPEATAGLMGGGGLMGILAATSAAVTRPERQRAIRLSGAAWLPLPAALSVAAIQACAAVQSLAGLILSLAALEAAVGFGVGAAFTLIVRRMTIGRRRASGATAGGSAGEAQPAGR